MMVGDRTRIKAKGGARTKARNSGRIRARARARTRDRVRVTTGARLEKERALGSWPGPSPGIWPRFW